MLRPKTMYMPVTAAAALLAVSSAAPAVNLISMAMFLIHEEPGFSLSNSPLRRREGRCNVSLYDYLDPLRVARGWPRSWASLLVQGSTLLLLRLWCRSFHTGRELSFVLATETHCASGALEVVVRPVGV